MIDNKIAAAISVAVANEFENRKKAAAIALAMQKQSVVDPKIVAAIFTALYPYISIGVHDYQTPVLTIKRIDRPYTPWSSKIYQIRQTPVVQRNIR